VDGGKEKVATAKSVVLYRDAQTNTLRLNEFQFVHNLEDDSYTNPETGVRILARNLKMMNPRDLSNLYSQLQQTVGFDPGYSPALRREYESFHAAREQSQAANMALIPNHALLGELEREARRDAERHAARKKIEAAEAKRKLLLLECAP
jgi:hypothetical protein